VQKIEKGASFVLNVELNWGGYVRNVALRTSRMKVSAVVAVNLSTKK
jgi:hypothetical protein